MAQCEQEQEIEIEKAKVSVGVFSNVRAAKVSKSGRYYQEGNYIVEIQAVKMIVSAEVANKHYFIVETVCKESDNPDIKPGDEYSQVIDMQNIMAGANIKIFLAAASDVDAYQENDALNEQIEDKWSSLLEREVDMEKICEIVTSNENPLAGIVLGLQCVTVKTRPTVERPQGGTFTKHQWFALDESEAA